MTSDELAPVLIVLGIITAIGIGRLGWRMRERARRPKEPVDSDDTATPASETHIITTTDDNESVENETVPWKDGQRSRYKNGTWLFRGGWLLGIVTVLMWGYLAIGWAKFLLVLLMIIGVPGVLAFVIALIAVIREERNSGPSRLPWMLGAFLGVGLLLTSTHLVVNGLSVREFLGYAHSAQLHVTDSYDGSNSRKSSSSVSGTYLFDGEQHRLDRSSWDRSEPVPEAGEVTELSIGPLWPRPVMTGPWGAGRLFIFAAGSGVAGVVALVMSVRGRRNIEARISEHRAAQQAEQQAVSE